MKWKLSRDRSYLTHWPYKIRAMTDGTFQLVINPHNDQCSALMLWVGRFNSVREAKRCAEMKRAGGDIHAEKWDGSVVVVPFHERKRRERMNAA